MKRAQSAFLLPGFLVLLICIWGCSESTLEDEDTNGDLVSAFTVFRTEDGLADNAVTDMAVDYIFDGVWFATRNGISFYSNTDSTFYTYGAEYDIPDMEVISIAVDYTGTVWAGTVSGVSSMAINDTLWTSLADRDSLVNRYVTEIVPMTDFTIWFGTRVGASVKSLQGWTSYITELGASSEVTSIAAGALGDIWVGTTNGISVFDGENWKSYGSDVLPSTYVKVVYKDSGGRMWCGTSSGAVLYDGTSWVTYGSGQGLTSSGINDFRQDNFGMLWAATDVGVYYMSGDTWKIFSLPGNIAGSTALALTVDLKTGTLWIGTDNGVVRYTTGYGE